MHKVKQPCELQVLASVPVQVRLKALDIKLVAFDVDGVLTDGALYLGSDGEVMKRFHTQDGGGINRLRENGFKVVWITGRGGPIVEKRAQELGIHGLYQNARDKYQIMLTILEEHKLTLKEVAFMGDDILDYPLLKSVGLSASVPHAPTYIKEAAHWISAKEGGHGAAREFIDIILAAQGLLSQSLKTRINLQ
ncbi:KdsC family phosphatase [Taylorella equigenitalis]|uniref:3-deoxy-D-manno-octulosonate 8-phosphate phosphatase KdsC n=1 Tax=Taylorella equigenitalis (strain MCE9) TaxID=937774 RepID=A0A654KH69_TAYEM|nr:HAD hydrolase family protein [Taylorella equigenitalis]ADU91793.1 3-deoxy-D-manno-octulosonate 8-phosphate phosphatase [Taylorella equigenitalis MCE9]WDU56572.1 HAD hydrolase family protein [Taylorella equigenitalis]